MVRAVEVQEFKKTILGLEAPLNQNNHPTLPLNNLLWTPPPPPPPPRTHNGDDGRGPGRGKGEGSIFNSHDFKLI